MPPKEREKVSAPHSLMIPLSTKLVDVCLLHGVIRAPSRTASCPLEGRASLFEKRWDRRCVKYFEFAMTARPWSFNWVFSFLCFIRDFFTFFSVNTQNKQMTVQSQFIEAREEDSSLAKAIVHLLQSLPKVV